MFRALSPPLLVCVDFQREYAAAGRPLYIADFERLLVRAAELLALARSQGWLVAHAMVRREGMLFGAQTEHARPLPGFEPHGAEMIFCREEFSVYGNKDFGRLLERNRGAVTLMMALGGPYSLLHTVFDAHARGDELTLVEDVVGAPEICASAAGQAAAVTKAIAGSMHRLISSEDIFERAGWTGDVPARPASILIGRGA